MSSFITFLILEAKLAVEKGNIGEFLDAIKGMKVNMKDPNDHNNTYPIFLLFLSSEKKRKRAGKETKRRKKAKKDKEEIKEKRRVCLFLMTCFFFSLFWSFFFDSFSLLHYTVTYQNVVMTKYLFENGAKLSENDKKETPLSIAQTGFFFIFF